MKRLGRNLNDAVTLYNRRNHPIVIETKERTYSMNSSEIIVVESANRKTVLYTTKGELVSTKNMDYWETVLPQNTFFRTHRNHLVNLEYVTDFSNDTVNLSDGKTSVYLAARKYSAFKKAFVLYIER